MAKLPKFKTERQLADFFDTHDTTEFFDEMPEEPKQVQKARPGKQQIAIRIDVPILDKAKEIAKSKGIGYQTLMRMWIIEGIRAESKRAS
ncbi:MAG: hypothetical protein HY675_19050 [Chloroflexi bacterium]|nr:hypothetical protein [Chloroflexota bacterium]